MSRKILTYYTPLAYRPPDDDYRLMLLWKKNWESWGFEPVVLTEYHARQHPDYEKFNARVADFPSVNPPEYDRACYMRWLAYAVAGGGVAADYDLFCYKPQDHKTAVLNEPLRNTLQCFQRHVPSLVAGDEGAYQSVVRGIMKYEVGLKDVGEFNRPHVSDMHIFLRGKIPHDERHIVRNFDEDQWLTFPFTHWSSGSMAVRGYSPKWKFIPELRRIEK